MTQDSDQVRKTDCCAASLIDGKCQWCGNEAVAMELYGNPLYKRIESRLCDWDSPRKLATYDLEKNIATVYQIIREQLPNPTPPGVDKGSAAKDFDEANEYIQKITNGEVSLQQSEPISELEQWLENRLFTYLDIRKSAYAPEQLKEFAESIQARLQKSFQDGVNKALEALPKLQPKNAKVDLSNVHTWGQLDQPQEAWNAAISQAKENITKLKEDK